MLITLYRSMISASLAVKIFTPPVNSIEEILYSHHQLIVSNGSSVHRMLLEADQDSDLYRLHKFFKLIPMKSEAIGLSHIVQSKVA